jgi:hypothetical protein
MTQVTPELQIQTGQDNNFSIPCHIGNNMDLRCIGLPASPPQRR